MVWIEGNTGKTDMIITRTPLRISLFGGGTDYPIWYNDHQGAVIGTSIDKYCYLSVKELLPYFEHNHRIVWSQIELCQTIDEIRHPSVRETLKYMDVRQNMEIHHFGDLPHRAGMGTSSAFIVGLLHALYTFKGVCVPKIHLANEATEIEQNILKTNVGSQDQILCSVGGFNRIDFPSKQI